MKNKFRSFISNLVYVVALFSFLGVITACNHEHTGDMQRISEAVAARFETADGESVVVDSEISLITSLTELEIQAAPMTPADDPEDWIYRITFNPVDKVPNGEEVIVYVHEKYLHIGSEYYLPIADVSFDSILEWFDGKAAYFID